MKKLTLKQSFICVAVAAAAYLVADYSIDSMKPEQINGMSTSAKCYGACVQDMSAAQAQKGYKVTSDELSGTDVYVVEYHGPVSIQASEIFREKLDAIFAKAKKGDQLILDIESPGGTSIACETDFHFMKQAKQFGLKTYSVTDNLAASCGYYLASSVDYIYSSGGAMMGNIGSVFGENPNPLKIAAEKVMGRPLKCIGSTKTKMVFAGCAWDDKIITDYINKSAQTFYSDVLSMRSDKIKKSDYELVFSAMPFSAREALSLGLTDEIKDKRSVYRDLYQKGANIKKVVIKYKKSLIEKALN